MEERTQLRTAAETDPVLADAMFLFQSAQEIDLYDQDTVNFLNYLVAQGLLTAERKEEIYNETT